MRTNKLNHNREFLFGIMALAVLVLCVVIVFWLWCFPDAINNKNNAIVYKVELTSGFVGDSTQLFVNDSLFYSGVPSADSLKIEIEPFEDEHMLMVVDALSGNVTTFNLEEKETWITLRKANGLILMTQRQ